MSAPLRYLTLDVSEGTDGLSTIEALASTSSTEHPAVLREAEGIIEWAWRRFPQTHGAVEDGADWDHDLQVLVEPGGWHSVRLTLVSCSASSCQ